MSAPTLDRLATALNGTLVSRSASDDFTVEAVRNNASAVRPGDLFCAIQGAKKDGHDFIPQAVSNGAKVIVADADRTLPALPPDVAVLCVRDCYLAWGILCAEAAGNPAKNFRVHGITGTNGKTSTAILLHHFLSAAGRRCGLLTTIFTDVCDGARETASGTMPDAAALQGLFLRLAASRADDAVMECSSHGLSQYRSGNLRYASAVFTNLTGDHLDYHKTTEAYFQAKKRLFSELAAPGAPCVVNLDDPYGERLFDELAHARTERIGVSFEHRGADAFVSSLTLAEAHTEFELVWRGKKLHLTTRLTGRHNVCNTVCAFAAAAALGIDPDRLAEAASDAPPAPGRLEPFLLRSGAHAFVDYAHTDDALLRVATALRTLKKPNGKLIVVFGCGGDRDRTKRPRMGKVAGELADRLIVTSDNPRSEDPMAIIGEILPGIPANASYSVEPDRAEAIRLAVEAAGPDDLVLIAGKGHEDYQEIAGVKHHFDDREEVRRYTEKFSRNA